MKEKREGGYRITKEFLALKLGIKERISTMDFDNEHGILLVYVQDDNLKETPEGGSVPLLRLEFKEYA